jgi:hypothetical protein
MGCRYPEAIPVTDTQKQRPDKDTESAREACHQDGHHTNKGGKKNEGHTCIDDTDQGFHDAMQFIEHNIKDSEA